MKDLGLSRLNYFYLIFAISWKSVNVAFFNIDGKSRLLFLITLIVFIINVFSSTTFRKLLGGKPAVIWLIWIIYNVFNMNLLGYDSEVVGLYPFFLINRLFCPLLCMVLVAKEYLLNGRKTARVVLIGFLIYSIVGATIMFINPIEGLTLGNDLALYALFIPFITAVLYDNKGCTKATLYLLTILTIVLVIVSAERKALGGLFILIVFIFLSEIKRLRPKNIILLLLFAFALYYGTSLIIEHTYMGERLVGWSDYKNADWMTQTDVNTESFAIFGTRAYHYAKGLALFTSHPINGIGLTNFTRVASYDLRLHSEYMVQLAECGLIGTFIFALFYYYFFKRLKVLRVRKMIERKYYIIFLGGLISILFLGLTTWQYECRQFYVVLGFIVGQTQYNLYGKQS